jgi:hypothetical protein
MLVRSAPWLLAVLAACGGAAGPGGKAASVKIQFAFFHFKGEHVTVTVDGRTAFDRTISVAPDNARLGLAAVAQVELPECADIVVKAARGKVAERLCLTAETKSIVVDAGPPLTIAAKDRYQGVD